jgi:fatty acid desaturase
MQLRRTELRAPSLAILLFASGIIVTVVLIITMLLFWIPATIFGVWYIVITVVLLPAIRHEAAAAERTTLSGAVATVDWLGP